jgi:membrane protein YdbS with pleckstrin-like domain
VINLETSTQLSHSSCPSHISGERRAGRERDSASSRHEIEGINREKARQQVEAILSTLLQDPILSDVPKHSLSVSDVDVLINLELGSAIRLAITKMDNTSFGYYSFEFIFAFISDISLSFIFQIFLSLSQVRRDRKRLEISFAST